MRILVVDDEPKVASLLRKALERQGYAVDIASSGDEALAKASSFDYDVILLDVMIPAPDGLEVCRRLRAKERWTPILLMSGISEIETRVEGLDAGADDYLTKPFAIAEVCARIRSLARRRLEERPTVLMAGDIYLDPATRGVTVAGSPVELTPKEFAFLELFLRNPGRVLTRGYILDHVWDFNFEINSNIIDVYVRYLRKKIDLDPEQSHIQSVRGIGYRLIEVSDASDASDATDATSA